MIKDKVKYLSGRNTISGLEVGFMREIILPYFFQAYKCSFYFIFPPSPQVPTKIEHGEDYFIYFPGGYSAITFYRPT